MEMHLLFLLHTPALKAPKIYDIFNYFFISQKFSEIRPERFLVVKKITTKNLEILGDSDASLGDHWIFQGFYLPENG